MATWGPIQLRLKGSRQVEFDGEASPAPGGGSTAKQGIYAGNAVTINDGDNDPLTWDTLSSGEALLDLSQAVAPTFVEAGTYAVTAFVYCSTALTPGGYAVANGAIGVSVGGATEHPEQGITITAIITVAAGDSLSMSVVNFDGAAPRDYQLYNVAVVKLT